MDQSRVMLMNLLPEVRYCMQVEIRLNDGKYSLPSNITCEMNTASGECPAYYVVLLMFFNIIFTNIH